MTQGNLVECTRQPAEHTRYAGQELEHTNPREPRGFDEPAQNQNNPQSNDSQEIFRLGGDAFLND